MLPTQNYVDGVFSLGNAIDSFGSGPGSTTYEFLVEGTVTSSVNLKLTCIIPSPLGYKNDSTIYIRESIDIKDGGILTTIGLTSGRLPAGTKSDAKAEQPLFSFIGLTREAYFTSLTDYVVALQISKDTTILCV